MILLVLLLNILLASSFTLAKMAVAYIEPLYFIGIRMILSSLLLVGYRYLKHRSIGIIKTDMPLFFCTAFYHIFLAYTLEFWALQYVTSIKTALLFSLTPMISALLAHLLGYDAINKPQWIAVLLVIIGSFIAMIDPHETSFLSDLLCGSIGLPECALLGSIAASAYGWLLVKELVINRGYSAILVNGVAMGIGGGMSLLMALYMNYQPLVMITPPLAPYIQWGYGVSIMAALIIIANIISYNLYGWLFSYYSPTFMALAGTTIPLFTALFSMIFLKEYITISFVISTIIIMAGLIIFYRYEKDKKKSPSH